MSTRDARIALACLAVALASLAPARRAVAMTPVSASGVSGSGFPVALSAAGETYQLSEDITCSTTCFSVKASNITLDLNGHTATFGAANNPNLANTDMEEWVDDTTLENWTVLSGSASRSPAVVWGAYDAVLSPTASLRSDAVNLSAGQTYVYYAMIRGSSNDSCTTQLRSASDHAVLASTTIGGGLLNRAFAMADGSVGAAEHEFKPATGVSAYLQIDCSGTSPKRLHVADVKPAKHYFLVSNNYKNDRLDPDLTADLFGGTSSGLRVHNGFIRQGDGRAVKSAAVRSAGLANLDHVGITMSGNNTSALMLAGSFTVDTVTIDTSSVLNFNRMHSAPGLSFSTGQTGAIEIVNSTFLNDPELAITGSYTFLRASDTHVTRIHGNTIRNREQVTEGYAIGLSGVANVEIFDNDINPFRGRGILLDAVANRSGYLDGTANVTIRNNTIQNIHEFATPEYGPGGLEAAAIRVRNWGGTDPPEAHRNLRIYDNTISVYADAAGSHRSYGISITVASPDDSIEFYNNSIHAVRQSSGGADWQAVCMMIQQNMTGEYEGSVALHHNSCTGDVGVRFGGNDGAMAKSIKVFANVFRTETAGVFFDSYQGPFSNNDIYCNEFVSTSATGYPIMFSTGASPPSFDGIYFSHNTYSAANPAGHAVNSSRDLSASVFFCGDDDVVVDGGGAVGHQEAPCHDGAAGCVENAGPQGPDTTAPSTTVSPPSGTYPEPQTVTLECLDNLSCVATYTCMGSGCTPTTAYEGPVVVAMSGTLRYYSADAAGNDEPIREAAYDIRPLRVPRAPASLRVR